MGSLANQYISQSYTSLIHLSSDTTASATLTALQDGLGNGLGIFVNTLGDISASNTITTNNIVVNTKTELTGAFALNTYFTASTLPYVNSTQPYFTDTVYVTGSYGTNTYPPSIADVKVGWLGNGVNVTNGVVTAVSKSVSGYFITMAGQSPQIAQSYTFRGQASPNATISGSLVITENLIVSGTFDIEGKIVVNDNVRINGNLEVSGSQRNTGSLFVSNEISSSTINGIGNVTAFSQSLYAEFTNLENYTSSLRAAFTASGVNTIFTNDITASNIEVRNNLNVVGTITANKIVTLIESSSVIFSSGSNILGDSILDTQTLNGDVIMSGSASLTGSMGISNNLEVKGNISSSTISGIGNVTTYSASVQSYINSVSSSISGTVNTLSQSVDQRLGSLQVASASLQVASSSLQNFSASVTSSLVSIYQTTASLNTFSASTNISLTNLNLTTQSLNNSVSLLNDFSASAIITASAALNTITFTKGNLSTFNVTLSGVTFDSGSYVTTSSFNAYTSSTNVRLNNLETTTASLNTSVINLNSFSSSQLTQNSALAQVTSSLISFTGSYATTGSNVFTGSQVFSGSVRGRVINLSVTSQTASMDLSLGNFFTLTLPTASVTHLNPTNIQPGETIQLLVKQQSITGSLNYPNTILFATGSDYSASVNANAQDILSFVTFDTSSIYAVSIKNLV